MSAKLLKPHALKLPASVAILPLASLVKKNIGIEGVKYARQLGITPSAPLELTFKNYKYLFSSAPAKIRANELTREFISKQSQAIFSLRGGYGSTQLLPFLRLSAFKKLPKIFVGFSDITALLINLYQKSNLICFHGPSIITFGFKIRQGNLQAKKSIDSLMELLKGNIINPFENYKLDFLKKGKKNIKGRLTGGNLSILCSLIGTKWQPDFKNHIVFLEEIAEPPYKVHRMLIQLKQAGLFKGVKGILLGDFIDTRKEVDKKEPDYDRVFLDIFKDSDISIWKGLPIGHADLNLAIPIGVNAELFHNRLEITESSVVV